MSKFKFYITMNCVSFTVLALIYTVLCLFGMSAVNELTILILLLMTTCIAVIIFFTDKLPVNSMGLRTIIDLAVIMAVVFGIGVPPGFIPFDPANVLIVLAMIIVVYFVTFGVLIIKNKADADDINKKISAMKRKK
ncbi:MAG: DUF3021 family protein [Christensenella sp.]|uniref:DUF3021 family protein n=1 Tax=Christensenella sp. TaxID=1935934 RepID=UPI002B1F7F53|nr:DUF3021 family protein [Christensenella sp.]MEA5004122.1 DUF3021 family protein [Christensenella sp.]